MTGTWELRARHYLPGMEVHMLFKRFHTVRILNRDGKVYKAGWVEQAFNTQRPQYLVRTARDQYELADANRVVGHKIS